MHRSAALACFLLLAGAAGCASGPTVDDAQELLANGDADAALVAVHEAQKRPLDQDKALRARLISFEASLALGRSDEAARDFLALRLPARERERLREKLAGSTLRAAFESPDGGRRAVAASDLVLAGSHPKLMLLAQVALADREPIVRRAAVVTVGRLPDLVPSVVALERALDDCDESVQAEAALALAARIGRARTGEPSEVTEARAALVAHGGCAEALELVGAKPLARVTPALERSGTRAPEASDRDRAFSPSSPDAAERRRAFLAADRLEPFSVEALRAALAARDPAVAPDAARLLAERGAGAAVPALVQALQDGASPARIAAAHALGALGGPEAVSALLRALQNEDGLLRRAAARALARSGDATALEDLARSISDPRDDSDLAAAAAVLAIEARTGFTVNSASRSQEGP